MIDPARESSQLPLPIEAWHLLDRLYYHHPATYEHSMRVGRLALQLARRLDLSDDQIARTYIAGVLHDVGKLSVPTELLEAPRALTARERTVMHGHSRSTRLILLHYEALAPYADDAALHHERFDRSGYPYGLGANQIPVATKILTVADVYDAMTNPRPYQQKKSEKAALRAIENGAERWWCPRAVTALQEHLT